MQVPTKMQFVTIHLQANKILGTKDAHNCDV